MLNRKGLDNTDFFDKRRVIVKGNNKVYILHELSILGIDSGTVYKGIEEKLKAILKETKWEYNKLKGIKL